MAEAWCRTLWGERYQAFSAGIEAHGLDSLMVQVMAEAGVDLAHARSTRIKELGELDPDYVITVWRNARPNALYIQPGFATGPALFLNRPV